MTWIWIQLLNGREVESHQQKVRQVFDFGVLHHSDLILYSSVMCQICISYAWNSDPSSF